MSSTAELGRDDRTWRSFVLVTRVVAVAFVLVGASHLVLGLRSDMSLGAQLPLPVVNDPVLDSQNRFYGVMFAGSGALLWLCARDPARYTDVLRIVCWSVFAGGVARLLSIALAGVPTVPVVALTAIELIGFPLLVAWHRRSLRDVTA